MHLLLWLLVGWFMFALLWRVLRWTLRIGLLVLVLVGVLTCRTSGFRATSSRAAPMAAPQRGASRVASPVPHRTPLPPALRDAALGR